MTKRNYVDGYIIPMKKSAVPAYKKMAKLGCKVWMDHGALDYYECLGDDLQNDWGLPFMKLCQLKAGETVVIAFITYKSKAHRNRVNALAMQDPRLQMDLKKMPFDMKRFTVGGFKVMVGAAKKS